MYIFYVPEQEYYSPNYFLDGLAKFTEKSKYIIINSAKELSKVGNTWILVIRLPSIYHLKHKPKSAIKKIQNPTLNEVLVKQKELIKLYKPKIILDMGIECFFSREELFIGLHQLAEELEIPCKNITILETGLNTSEKYLSYCRRHQINDCAEFVHFMPGGWQFCESFLESQSTSIQNISRLTTIKMTERKKIFVSMNGRIRDHRLLLCFYLFIKGFLTHSNVSLLLYGADRKIANIQMQNIEKLLGQLCLKKDYGKEAELFIKMLPLELDVNACALSDSDLYTKKMVLNLGSHEYFNEAKFNLVTETLFFDDNAFMVTEKSFKAFATDNPFVIFAHCGTLKFMKSLGFSSYEGIVDESYDSVSDGLMRMGSCLSEVDRLANLKIHEIVKLTELAGNIFEENQFFLRNILWGVLKRDFNDSVLSYLTRNS